jgi:hypothetical protein
MISVHVPAMTSRRDVRAIRGSALLGLVADAAAYVARAAARHRDLVAPGAGAAQTSKTPTETDVRRRS